MIDFKKIVAMIVLSVSTLQIGCAHTPVHDISSVDEIWFRKGYTYDIEKKDGQSLTKVPGTKISTEEHKVLIHDQFKSKMIDQSDIASITSTKNKRSGSYWAGGAAIGGVVAGTGTLLTLSAFALVFTDLCGQTWDGADSKCSNKDLKDIWKPVGYGTAIATGAGVLLGGFIGAMIPKYEKLTFIPIVNTSSNEGTSAGGSLEVRF